MRLIALPAFDDNYIWALVAEDGAAVVVDPGDAAPVLAAADEGLRPVAVLVTHHHGDHIAGLPALRARWPGIAVHAPHDERIAHATGRVADGDRVEVEAAGLAFETLAVPGHTRSHVAYVRAAPGDAGAGLAFCGDTLFSLGCGRLFEGTPAQMLASLSRLAALPGDTRVCCTHEYTLSNLRFAAAVEPDNAVLSAHTRHCQALRAIAQPTLPSSMALELQINPFLRSREPAVVAAARAQGAASADPVAVLAALREWKNRFR